MWQTTLYRSRYFLILFTIFYISLMLLLLYCFKESPFNCLSFIIIPLTTFEWFHSYCYWQKIQGNFAYFLYLDQIYWSTQRWSIIRKPLLYGFMIILNLKSCRSGRNCTLILMSDSFSKHNWRTLHYYFQQINISQ